MKPVIDPQAVIDFAKQTILKYCWGGRIWKDNMTRCFVANDLMNEYEWVRTFECANWIMTQAYDQLEVEP